MMKHNTNKKSTLSQKSVEDLINIILRKDDVDCKKNIVINSLRTELEKCVITHDELENNIQTMNTQNKATAMKLEVALEREMYYRKSYNIYRYSTCIMLCLIILLVIKYVY